MPIVNSASELLASSFDYIVVGGGTAGLVVASRLAENPSVKVAVLEAGEAATGKEEIDDPDFLGTTIANPNYDWTFFSTPQAHVNNRSVIQSRGKGLGGSCLLNFMASFRPSKPELDAFAQFTDVEGWNWDGLVEYMKKSEGIIPTPQAVASTDKLGINPDPSFHGTNGPVKMSVPNFWNKQYSIISETLRKLGVDRNLDSYGGSNLGDMCLLLTIDSATNTRSYPPNTYLSNAGENLVILCDALATKIVLESDSTGSQTAKGVEFIAKDGNKYEVGAKREVIVSCGTFQTPQLLELSGIGNRAILDKVGIQTKVDLVGVGENLQDHICVPTVVETDPSSEEVDTVTTKDFLKFDKDGRTTSVGSPHFLFLSSEQVGVDVESWKSHAKSGVEAFQEGPLKLGYTKQVKILEGWITDNATQAQGELILRSGNQPLPPPLPLPGSTYTSITAAVCHPLSRGSVHVVSASPRDPPAIDPNYLSNPADLEVLAKVLQTGIKIRDSAPFADVIQGWTLPPAALPDGSPTPFQDWTQDVEKIKAWIKMACTPVFHPVGTASIGKSKEEGAVVDGELKVFGVKGLRVVDASVIPLELSTHILCVLYGIAEKAADMIKASYGSSF